MEIIKVVTGALDENCYVLVDNGTCLVVDPGDDFPKIKEACGDDFGTYGIDRFNRAKTNLALVENY